jgi:hypothetical protein
MVIKTLRIRLTEFGTESWVLNDSGRFWREIPPVRYGIDTDGELYSAVGVYPGVLIPIPLRS